MLNVQKRYLKQNQQFLDNSFFPNTLKNRFYNNISLPNENGCMIYLKNIQKTGYARIWNNKKRILVHRLSYLIFKGKIPTNSLICHSCDNPSCVSPDHLWIGSSADNARDRSRKKRSKPPIGEKNGHAKLNSNNVIEIRKLLAKKEISQAEMARRFGVHPNAIYKIKYKLKWSHIEEN